MSITGVNPEQVKSSISGVKTAFDAVYEALITDSQNLFIQPMSSLWASPDAVEFFKKYDEAISSLKSSVINTFTSVIVSMNSAARNMNSLGGATWTDVENDVDTSATLDVTIIKDNLNGVIGVDKLSASSTAETAMSTIESRIKDGLGSASRAVMSSGFTDDEMQMQENLVSSLNMIQAAVSSSFSTLRTSISKAIENTENAYKSESGKVAAAFGGGSAGGGGNVTDTMHLKI